MSNLQNFGDKRHILTDSDASRGGQHSGETRRKKKSFQDVLTAWSEMETSEENKRILAKLGFTEEQTNLVSLIIPLLNNIKKGDTKSLKLLMEWSGQDKKYQAEIDKLQQEIELLKAQNGLGGLEPVHIVMDVKKSD